MSTLTGYFGGLAHTGASYEIELRTLGDCHTVTAYSAAAGGPRQPQGVLYQGTDLIEAHKKLLKKAKDKFNGRERQYTRGLPTTSHAGTACPGFPSKAAVVGELPDHPLLWAPNYASARLPYALRKEIDAGTSLAVAAAPLAIDATVVTTRGLNVMLCQTATDAEPYIADDGYIAMRKVEGRRVTLELTEHGEVRMYNRRGDLVACPDHIATAMRDYPYGTHLDGELVVFNPDGRESLYGGLDEASLASSSVFVAFDLLALANISELDSRQDDRLRRLADLIREFPNQPIEMAAFAVGTEAKAVLRNIALQHGWEGLIFRPVELSYTQGRDWTRYKMRRATLDAVVLGYQAGKGRHQGRVGAVSVGLYRDGDYVDIGEVGSGWSDAERGELQRRWEAGQTGYVVTVIAEGFTAGGKLIRPSAVAIREPGDKRPEECGFEQVPDLGSSQMLEVSAHVD